LGNPFSKCDFFAYLATARWAFYLAKPLRRVGVVSMFGLFISLFSKFLVNVFGLSAFLARTAGVLIALVAFSNDYWARMYTRVALLPCHLGFAPTDQRRLTCFLFGSLWPARFYSTSRVVLLSTPGWCSVCRGKRNKS